MENKTAQEWRVGYDSNANPLSEYKRLADEIKRLEAEKDQYKKAIFTLMDELKSDKLSIGAYNAERKLIVQTRVDSDLVKAVLGEEYPSVCKESSQVRLTIV